MPLRLFAPAAEWPEATARLSAGPHRWPSKQLFPQGQGRRLAVVHLCSDNRVWQPALPRQRDAGNPGLFRRQPLPAHPLLSGLPSLYRCKKRRQPATEPQEQPGPLSPGKRQRQPATGQLRQPGSRSTFSQPRQRATGQPMVPARPLPGKGRWQPGSPRRPAGEHLSAFRRQPLPVRPLPAGRQSPSPCKKLRLQAPARQPGEPGRLPFSQWLRQAPVLHEG